MPTSDTSEHGFESLITSSLTGKTAHAPDPDTARESPAAYGEAGYGAGYVEGDWRDYDRSHAVDTAKLLDFLRATQPEVIEQFSLEDEGSPERNKFLSRLQGEVAKRGVVDVLRGGVRHGPASVSLFYGSPTPGNEAAKERFAANVFSVTRQLRYSLDETKRALDLVVFINGLPVATFELKNLLTRQTVEDAVEQYKTDRDPRELIFQFKRCLVHFAVDDQEVRFCTELKGRESWFLPFNRGWDDGAGNPPNPDGIKTAYLWRGILTRSSLTDIIENYAEVVEEQSEGHGKKRRKRERQIFPRYHQLDVVRKLLADARKNGEGRKYLIQHSAGSGKSNSIAWLAHQLVGLEHESRAVFDSVIVVTDRIVLDHQLRATIKQFAQVSATVGHSDKSSELREHLESGKKIIITRAQQFPFILDTIGDEHRGRTFAIIIDEAQSGQGGRMTAAMSKALGIVTDDEEATTEDFVNLAIESRRMLANASYFAFTATPKHKTLQMFGEKYLEGDEEKYRAFHSYTMKQAIQEGFILDVLRNYTPVDSYYHLIKSAEDDPEFDIKRAQSKLRQYVESHEHAIRQKAEILVDHFHEQVLAKNKIGGQARAMVVTASIKRALKYHRAICDYLKERKSPAQAMVAFSGEHEWGGKNVTEATLNGFPSARIPDNFREDPYRFLIVADKFQTGYDEPFLHTMYVDKPLSNIKAVQTLSRLNRAHPKKHDTFVLDFYNDGDTIRKAFEPYYRTTILSQETDPNKLHDLKAALDGYQVYAPEEIQNFVSLYLGGADRGSLDPTLDMCATRYVDSLDEEGQVDFKGKAKAFTRTYDFLGAILPYKNPDWEKLSIFLTFLVPKLPAPVEEDLSQGILDIIDMDSYRAEARSSLDIILPDDEGEIGPIPTGEGGHRPEPEMDRLSVILKDFNDLFGNIDWKDRDKIEKVLSEEIPAKVSENRAYQNAIRNSGRENARVEHDKALKNVVTDLLSDHTELFSRFFDDPSFQSWLSSTVFSLTYKDPELEAVGNQEASQD